jgi:hypothetical protein
MAQGPYVPIKLGVAIFVSIFPELNNPDGISDKGIKGKLAARKEEVSTNFLREISCFITGQDKKIHFPV